MAFTRRAFLATGGATAAAAAAAGVGYAAGQDTGDDGRPGSGSHVVDFHGDHQAGIATPAQDRLHFAAFDVTEGVTAAELRDLLKQWTQASATMAGGRPIGTGAAGAPLAPPDDTGEALDLTPANLTVTFGFGASLFDDRFGLAAKRPKKLTRLPDLPGDALDHDRSDGDLCVQACADDPQVAFHAIRNLARIGRGLVTVRWSQLGFGRTSTTSRAQATPRNLLGFKDGTANIKLEDRAALDRYVWVGGDRPDEPAWLKDGSYLVARRIRMLIEVWDRASLKDQEQTIGRTKVIGAPLGGNDEFQAFEPRALPLDSHVRLAHPDTNGGIQILRRGYSFTDGLESLGQLDAGLFFLAYMRDPSAFVALQNRLGAHDSLNEYIKHVGSGLWAIPGGIKPGGYAGQSLLES
ncbi:MAG TPA: iron uptake transporter deferrochelatase/peroxidase subunit [Baekduia sp.]|uniref:iron uptake transporter deferrochelatase/peroxidase subunit n=1 Tax=Baekduia sp. TaxID=2600305 RepID=UPI002D79F105|nr:iron uptake transporter deferrochelatase/peroxidase subunit [Baekduia sp.]HET6509453.1 iron uptake transporter deferrochelatase/peroxidase subunit [Baekduia sp.]